VQRRRAFDLRARAGKALRRELIARLPRERLPRAADVGGVRLAQQPAERARIVMLEVGVEQAEG